VDHLEPKQVQEFLRKHPDALFIDCRSGNRSLEAGQALERHGFARIYNVRDGFEGPLNEKHQRNVVAGWRHDGLPWEQC